MMGGLVDTGAVSQVEQYDPATNRWTAAVPLPADRAGAVAAVLPGGGVLVAGGLRGSLPSNAHARSDAFVYTDSGSTGVAKHEYVPIAAPAPSAGGAGGLGPWVWLSGGVGALVVLAALFFVLGHRRRPEADDA